MCCVIYQLGDIIIAIDDQSVNTEADLFKILEARKPGDVITITAQRYPFSNPFSNCCSLFLCSQGGTRQYVSRSVFRSNTSLEFVRSSHMHLKSKHGNFLLIHRGIDDADYNLPATMWFKDSVHLLLAFHPSYYGIDDAKFTR